MRGRIAREGFKTWDEKSSFRQAIGTEEEKRRWTWLSKAACRMSARKGTEQTYILAKQLPAVRLIDQEYAGLGMRQREEQEKIVPRLRQVLQKRSNNTRQGRRARVSRRGQAALMVPIPRYHRQTLQKTSAVTLLVARPMLCST